MGTQAYPFCLDTFCLAGCYPLSVSIECTAIPVAVPGLEFTNSAVCHSLGTYEMRARTKCCRD